VTDRFPSLGLRLLIGTVLLLLLVAGIGACSSESDSGGASSADGETELARPNPNNQTLIDVDEQEDPGFESAMFGAIEGLLSPRIPALRGLVANDGAPDLNRELAEGEPYRVGGLVTETIDSILIEPGICAGAEARLAGAAQRRELDRSVEWLGCIDDGGDADRYQSGLDRLLFADPFALVPLTSQHFLSGDRLTASGVIHAGLGEQPAYCGLDNRFGFAVSGAARCPVLAVSGVSTAGPVLQAWLEASGNLGPGLQLGVVVDSSRSGAESLAERLLEASAVGAAVAIADQRLAPGPGNGADLVAALIEDLMNADPDVIILDVADAPRLFEALRAAGFSGDLVGTSIDTALVSSSAEMRSQYRDTWQVIQGVALLSDGGGGWQRLTQDAALIAPTGPIGLGFVRGYASMDFLIAALSGVGDGPASPAAVHDLINSGWQYPGIPGVVCPSDWPVAHLTAVPCASVLRAEPDDSLRLALSPTMFDLLVAADR